MKNLSLYFLLMAGLTPLTQAQLIPGVVNQVNKITQDVDRVAEQVRRNAEREAERLRRDQLNKTTDPLLDPVAQLPERLPILNRQGQTAFVDVKVEGGWRAVQQEWLLIINSKDLEVLQTLPLEIVEKSTFTELDMQIVRVRVPPELDSLSELKKNLPQGAHITLDRNHIYSTQAKRLSSSASLPLHIKQACDHSVNVGMIDTAINTNHPALKTSAIITKNFLEDNVNEPDAHGTAVAGLLVGTQEGLTPLVPKANLYAASVFYARNDYAQGASMMNLVRALNWLLTEKVAVINMSLAGPDNQILAKAIEKINSSGKIIVAAAGNEGPAAPPVYPAAYPGVIAVTAVDRHQKIYRWANRGKQISFAALGVSVPTIRTAGDLAPESGTSMAAPVVSALVSCELNNDNNSKEAINKLIRQAIDLGEPGKDDIFGYGLLQ